MTPSQFTSPLYLSRREGRIAYYVFGDGPLVVCLPGMGEIAAAYRYTVPALVEAGFRVAVMDLRGHGASDATFTQYDDAAAGSDLLALIAHLGEPAVVLGTSMGAGAAVWAAGHNPEAVRGTALLGPFVRNVPTNPAMAFTFRLLMARPWARQSWLAYLPSLYPGTKPADFAQHRAAIASAMRRPGATAAFSKTTRTDHSVAESSIPRVTAPTIVIMGTADPDYPNPRAEAEWISERLNAPITFVEGAGHYPQAQHPDIVNPVLIDFCRTVTARA